MKAGIITMHKVPNFGSHLQAYALQTALEKLGIDAELIDYKYPNNFHLTHQENSIYKISLKRKILRIIFFPNTLFGKIISFRRKQLFRKFENEYFKLSKYYSSPEELKKAELPYDLYITGSDQVWNPRFGAGDSIFMCDFGNDYVPRIAFGASVTSSKIPDSMADIYSTCLNW